jgi:hypothetical protein
MNIEIDEAAIILNARKWMPSKWFRILILFEDDMTGREAMRLFDNLVQQISMDHLVDSHFWKLAEISHPEVREGVVESAAAAELIVVAGREDSVLAQEAERAIDAGIHQKPLSNGILVGLVGCENSAPEKQSKLLRQLRELAARHGLQFFPGLFELQGGSKNFTMDKVLDRAERITTTLHRILKQPPPFPHGGINE